MKKQPNRIGDRRVVELSYETLAWLFETLHGLAPRDVALRMEETIVDAKDPAGGGATWTHKYERTDVHENMGTAVEDIVAELRADSLLVRAARRLIEAVDFDSDHYEAQSPVENCAIAALGAVLLGEDLAEAYLDALDASDVDESVDDGWELRKKEPLQFFESFAAANVPLAEETVLVPPSPDVEEDLARHHRDEALAEDTRPNRFD